MSVDSRHSLNPRPVTHVPLCLKKLKGCIQQKDPSIIDLTLTVQSLDAVIIRAPSLVKIALLT